VATSAIVVTAGSASANAYVTLAVADQYHRDRPANDTVWADAMANADKSKANAGILLATKLLDKLVVWSGVRVDTTQALEWPRSGLVNPNGTAVSTTAIPLDLQHATADFAKHLITGERHGDSALDRYGLSKLSVPGIALEFTGQSPSSNVVPVSSMQLLPDDWGHLKVGLAVELVRA